MIVPHIVCSHIIMHGKPANVFQRRSHTHTHTRHHAPHNAPVTQHSEHFGYYRSHRFHMRMRLRSALCWCASAMPSIALIMHAIGRTTCVCVCFCSCACATACLSACIHNSQRTRSLHMALFSQAFCAGPHGQNHMHVFMCCIAVCACVRVLCTLADNSGQATHTHKKHEHTAQAAAA